MIRTRELLYASALSSEPLRLGTLRIRCPCSLDTEILIDLDEMIRNEAQIRQYNNEDNKDFSFCL